MHADYVAGSLSGKVCLVTGAGGFIGSHLAEELVRVGARVRGFIHYNALGSRGWLDRAELGDEVQVFSGDITDRDSLRRAFEDVEVVFHLAALIPIPYSYVAPESFLRTNAIGTLNALQLARETGSIRFVHTSTSEVYGTARSIPMTEAHPLQAQSPYAASKIAADKIAEAMALSFDIPVITVRPFNTYGPRQSMRAVIPTIITQCLEDGVVRLGNTHPTRDFTFVQDTVRGFVAAAAAPTRLPTTVNLGSGREISVGAMVELVAQAIGRSVEIITESPRQRPESSEVDRLVADAGRARELLGWRAETSLNQGLKETIAWFDKNLESHRARVYQI